MWKVVYIAKDISLARNLEKILNVGTCCNSHNITDDISGDDFCVFMDSDFFASTDIVQICSIVDYYTDDIKYANSILERFKSVAYDFIVKPPDLNRLLVTVRNAIDKSDLVTQTKQLKKEVDFVFAQKTFVY